jgi:hypothetical protein
MGCVFSTILGWANPKTGLLSASDIADGRKKGVRQDSVPDAWPKEVDEDTGQSQPIREGHCGCEPDPKTTSAEAAVAHRRNVNSEQQLLTRVDIAALWL